MISLQVPGPIREEHQTFHDELLNAIKTDGKLGKIAKEIDDLLTTHFKIEEESAFPPLILMLPLSRGEIDPDMKAAFPIIARLKNELPRLSEDHQKIIYLLKDFDDAAKTERKGEFTQFSQQLTHHAKAEESILFPASILIGKYLSLTL